MPFNLDTKSLLVGAVIGFVVVPMVQMQIAKARSK